MKNFYLIMILFLPLLCNSQTKDPSFLTTTWYFVGDSAFTGGDANYFDMEVNNNHEIFVAYNCDKKSPSFQLYVDKFNGADWEGVGAEVTLFETDNTCLKFSPSDTPYVAFTNYISDQPSVRKFDGITWSDVGTLPSGSVNSVSLTIHADGSPYVAISDNQVPFLQVKKFNETNWVQVGGFVSNKEVENICLAMSPDQIPYVAYSDYNNNKISVKKLTGTRWMFVGTEEFTIPSAYYVNLKLSFSNTGIPYIAFADVDYNIHVMKFNGTIWVSVGDSIVHNLTYNLDLQISESGVPYVAYGKDTNVKLFDGLAWVSVGNPTFYMGEARNICLDLNYDNNPVVGFNGSGIQSLGASVMHYGDPTSSIYNKKSLGISIYPNPTTDYITLDLNNLSNGNKVVEIVDITGKIVFQSEFITNAFKINVFNFERGLFFIRVKTCTQIFADKFVKN